MIAKIRARMRLFGERYPRLRVATGVFLIVVGLAAFVTPLTPGSWLALIGLELLGVRILIREQAKRLRR
jgi:hypothetical protein